MSHRRDLANVILLAWSLLSGCSNSFQSVTGGTPGLIHAGLEPLSDLQVTVHSVDGNEFHPIGFAVTRIDGRFELVSNDAEGPLVLTEGEYRCTLESAGAPYRLPKQFSNAAMTPLRINWTATSDKLDLQVPVPQMVK